MECTILHMTVTPYPCPNVSTTPIKAMGCRQCLPLGFVQLKGKHCRKPHCRNGVVHGLLTPNEGINQSPWGCRYIQAM